MSCLYGTCVHVCQLLCRLKRKIACKIRDEHSLVKDLPPPNETVAKMAAKHLPQASAKQGIKHHTLSYYYYTLVHCDVLVCVLAETSPTVTGGHAYPAAPG